MSNSIKKFKEDVESIVVPEEELRNVINTAIFNELEVKEARFEVKNRKKNSKWITALVASLLIIGTTWTVGGSYIADATNTLINQIFGSKEQFNKAYPNESEHLSEIEKHLELVEKQLSPKEFADYKRLFVEMSEIAKKMRSENREIPNADEKEKIEEVQKQLQKYENKISMLTTHTLKEAQLMVNYPITKPTFVPDGYKLTGEKVNTKEDNIGKDPVVKLKYRKGEFGFYITQEKIDKDKKDELENWDFEKTDSYTLHGYKIGYYHSDDTNVQGMRISVPKQGYKIVMFADVLSKAEMEKILLSMVNQ